MRSILEEQVNIIRDLNQRVHILEQEKSELSKEKEDLIQQFENFRETSEKEIREMQRDVKSLVKHRAYENLGDLISTLPGSGIDFTTLHGNQSIHGYFTTVCTLIALQRSLAIESLLCSVIRISSVI
jgi:hypothetical protein